MNSEDSQTELEEAVGPDQFGCQRNFFLIQLLYSCFLVQIYWHLINCTLELVCSSNKNTRQISKTRGLLCDNFITIRKEQRALSHLGILISLFTACFSNISYVLLF